MMYCNIVHKMSDEDSMEALRFQQDASHELGLKTTILIAYDDLFREESISYCKEQSEKYGDEIGCNMSTLQGPQYRKLMNTRELQLHLLSFDNQKKVVKAIFEKFKEVFGYFPKSIATYYISSPILCWIKENYPSVNAAIINCFDEGIHMYDGNRHGWNLFCEGSPWGAYYPSKKNSMCPASDKDDAIGIVGLPHLNRDMLMAHIGRDDCFSSHSANVQRGMVNKGKKCDYLYDFFYEWQKQDKYNDLVYYNTLVGSRWLCEGHNFEESEEDSRDLYRQTLQIYRDNVDAGKLVVCTMSEYADAHIEKCPFDTVDVNHWHDLLCGSKRELFWYSNSKHRMTVDANLGGAIVDLRPYVGRVNVMPGPDTESMWDGSYPYALHNWHRAAYHTCYIENVDLYQHRTTCSVEKFDNGEVLLTMKPVDLDVDEAEVTFQSTFLFKKDGSVKITRKILSSSISDKEYRLQEKFIGSRGTGVLPQDFRGTVITVENAQEKLQVKANYEDRILSLENADYVSAYVPQLNTTIELSPEGENTSCKAEEGYMFNPYYTLMCDHKNVKAGEEIVTWLRIK